MLWLNELKLQLQKDFALANLTLVFSKDEEPNAIIDAVVESLYRLLLEDFDSYLNLLYIVDVPEAAMKGVDGTDAVVTARQVGFLVMRRTFLKVWFKKKFKSPH